MKRRNLLDILNRIPMGLSNQSRLALHISEEELDDLVTEGLVVYEDSSFGDREGFAWFLTDEGRKALESSVVPYVRINVV